MVIELIDYSSNGTFINGQLVSYFSIAIIMIKVGKNKRQTLKNGDEIHLIIESEHVRPEQAMGFLFTVLQDMSRPTKVKDTGSFQIASLSMLFDIK